MERPEHSIETLAIHAGQEPEPITGAVMPPIMLSTTFAQDGPGKHKGFEYARTDNPTRRTMERNLAALEGAKHAIAFGSGCAASTVLFHTLRPGDHIVATDDVYGGTFRILDKVMKPMGIETTFVDMTDMANLEPAIRPETKLLFIETPTNPMLKLVDIAAAVSVARAKKIPVCVDNTFATPVLQRPLDLGADVVVHSLTKYLNGHSDVVGGVLMTSDDALAEQLKFLQNSIGAIPSPFDCFLVMRGVKTLPVRMERHARSAADLAEWLEARDEVEILVCAESLGGVESLIEHPAIMTHASVPKENRDRLGIVDGLIRLSVGLEGLDDLKADLDGALKASRA